MRLKSTRKTTDFVLKLCWKIVEMLFNTDFVLKLCWKIVEMLFDTYFEFQQSWYGLGYNPISTWNWVEILSKSTLISNQNTGDIIDQNQPEKLQISSSNLVEKLLKCYLVSTLHFSTVDLD
jgi:hypothetical protein